MRRNLPPKKEIPRLRKFYAKQNPEMARIILEHPEQNGGEGSYAVRWAREQVTTEGKAK